jgi:hypothetical protein
MTWSWRYEAEDGKPVGGPNEAFSSQADAESYLGQTWKDRVSDGANTAILMEDDRVEYRMSLEA